MEGVCVYAVERRGRGCHDVNNAAPTAAADDGDANKMTLCVTESANNQKLMLEYEKFQEQQAKMMKMQEDYDRQLQEMEESKERALEELTEYYETKLQEMTTKLEQVGKHSQTRSTPVDSI